MIINIWGGRVSLKLHRSLIHLHTLADDPLNLHLPIAPLCKPLATILRMNMRLLWSSWRPGHLRQSIFHVELAYVKNTVSSLVLVRSSSTCGHSTLDSSIVIHLHCWEKGSRLRSNLLLYNLMVVPLPVG